MQQVKDKPPEKTALRAAASPNASRKAGPSAETFLVAGPAPGVVRPTDALVRARFELGPGLLVSSRFPKLFGCQPAQGSQGVQLHVAGLAEGGQKSTRGEPGPHGQTAARTNNAIT